MPRTISVTQHPTSIAVIRGAYEWLCAEVHDGEVHLGAQRLYSSEDIGIATEHLSVLWSVPQMALPTDPPVEEWLKFQALLKACRAERGAMSSITEMSVCPSYQTIIGMGPSVIPFILTELEADGEEPDQWFWALRALTGENPVHEEDQGNYVQMARSWLEWGKRNGYAG
jgi:hypothetical protein